jgi:sugar/nucleoside kinase (ribokinase family)
MRTSNTYVIVDAEHNTRTCIHTPSSEDLLPEEVDQLDVRSFSHLHFDSRHTDVAAKLARAAAEAGVPSSIDAEKDRPRLEELLAHIECIFTNKHFPKVYTGW